MAQLNITIPDNLVPDLAKALWGPVDAFSGPMPAAGPAIKQRTTEWLKAKYRQYATAKAEADARAANNAAIESQVGGLS